MTVREIVAQYLTEHGFDGLYHAWCCGCEIDNLGRCGEGIKGYCQPGYKKIQPEDGWIMMEEKPGEGEG